MSDIGYLPIMVLLPAYFLAFSLRAPRWLQLSIAIPMGITGVWRLFFGLHLLIPTTIGRPLDQIVTAASGLALAVVLMRMVREEWRKGGDGKSRVDS